MGNIEMDPRQLRVAQRELEEAGAGLDGLGARMPDGGDYGAAGPLVELALAIQAEAGARLATEASMLGFAVSLCAADLGYTDARQAVEIITIGDGS